MSGVNASKILDPIIQTLDPFTSVAKDYINSNFNRYKIAGKRLNTLPILLKSLRDAIHKAEKERIHDDWLAELKGLETKAMEVLDDFEACKIREELHEGKLIKSISFFCKKLKAIVFSNKKLKRLENIFDLLQQVNHEIWGYVNKSEISAHINIKKTSMDRGKENIIFGRDAEVKEIMNVIRNHAFIGETSSNLAITNQKGVLVLPIIGVTGIGKTTLAQLIHDNEFVRMDFRLRTWVNCGYDCFDPLKFIHKIISNFKDEKSNYHEYNFKDEKSNYQRYNLHEALDNLCEILRGEKFFLVLDDVWEDMFGTPWSTIKNILDEGAAGSVIIVTTQFRSVCDAMKTVCPIILGVLKWDDFWDLFHYHAFGNSKFDHDKKLLRLYGIKIAKSLNGTPLEAKSIGKFLNNTKHEWDYIFQTGCWNVDTPMDTRTILEASYQKLNIEERHSLLYCSIFPRGHAFEKNQLVNMWIALRLVEATVKIGRRERESNGRKRLDAFTNQFFFVEISESRYVMDGLIRDLIISIFKNEFSNLNEYQDKIPEYACHLSISTNRLVTLLGKTKNEMLQTVVFLGDANEELTSNLKTAFKKTIRSLRLLDISNMTIGTREFPDIFAKIPYLRYLNLSSTKIDSLPESICSLCFLEFLDLRGCKFKSLPKKMNNLINLRHFYASAETFSLIYRVGKLTNLRELEEFSVKLEKGHRINELMHMNKITGKLIISNLDCVHKKEEAIESKLNNKNRLDCLALKWNKNEEVRESNLIGKKKFDCLAMKRHKKEADCMEIVEYLEPHSGLKEIEFINYPGTCLPKWISEKTKSSILQHVKIVGGGLKVLPPLGQMHFLHILILEDLKSIKKIETRFYDSLEVFPTLLELHLIGMEELEELEEWNDIQGREMFPYLEKLTIRSCPALKSLPNNLLRKLKELEIVNCSQELTVRYARKKISHLPSIQIDQVSHSA